MREHAEKYIVIRSGEGVDKLEVSEESVKLTTATRTYEVGAVIIATGAEHRKLGVKGEQEFAGVKFKIGEALIQLAGKTIPQRPEKVEGIPVNRRFTNALSVMD